MLQIIIYAEQGIKNPDGNKGHLNECTREREREVGKDG